MSPHRSPGTGGPHCPRVVSCGQAPTTASFVEPKRTSVARGRTARRAAHAPPEPTASARLGTKRGLRPGGGTAPAGSASRPMSPRGKTVWRIRHDPEGDGAAQVAAATKRATTFLVPALSKATSSLSPSMACTVPGPNF